MPRGFPGFTSFAQCVLVLSAAAPTSGCLTRQYDVDRGELLALDADRRWTTLGDSGSSDAPRADRGVVLDDGATARSRRAPLDRFGFAGRLELGAATLGARSGTADYAPQMRLAFGGFPLHRVGILVGGQFAAGTVDDPSASKSAVFDGRVFGEVDWFPLRVGSFYGGAFGEVGAGMARQDLGASSLSKNAVTIAAGPVCEIALTTRLALSFRANAASIPSLTASPSVWVPEFAVGLSVY